MTTEVVTINQYDAEHYTRYKDGAKMSRADVNQLERDAIRVIWSTAEFLRGNDWAQRQYEVRRKG